MDIDTNKKLLRLLTKTPGFVKYPGALNQKLGYMDGNHRNLVSDDSLNGVLIYCHGDGIRECLSCHAEHA